MTASVALSGGSAVGATSSVPLTAFEDARTQDTITAFGSSPDFGPYGSPGWNADPVAMAAAPDGAGYWIAATDGGVFTFGRVPFLGSAGALPLQRPVVGMAVTPSGNGYWLVASDGGIFAYGDAAFYGSTGGIRLNRPVVGMAATPSGHGYWLVAGDGGIFAYGDAAFRGSTGAIALNQPVVGMATAGSGAYWLVARDGGIFSFGGAPFYGSAAGEEGSRPPTVSMAASAGGAGYVLLDEAGHLSFYGNAIDLGSSGDDVRFGPARTVVLDPVRLGYWILRVERPQFSFDDSGPGVVALQVRLGALGYWFGAADGVYGNLTEQAVYAFQKAEGLDLTGAVDPATSAALNRASRPRGRSTSGYVVEIDLTRQLLLVVRDGFTELAFNTSTGSEIPYTFDGVRYDADTPVGQFTIVREVDGVDVSPLGTLYRSKYFENARGIAIHGYTSVPPYPASHGCVRISNQAIDFVWAAGIMPIGTRVWVYR